MTTTRFIITQCLRVEEMYPEGKLKLLRKQQPNKKLGYTEDQCLVLISLMFMCLIPPKKFQPAQVKVKLGKSTTFLDMLMRDPVDPSKDGIKSRKLEFLFNYFELERQKASLPPQKI